MERIGDVLLSRSIGMVQSRRRGKEYGVIQVRDYGHGRGVAHMNVEWYPEPVRRSQ